MSVPDTKLQKVNIDFNKSNVARSIPIDLKTPSKLKQEVYKIEKLGSVDKKVQPQPLIRSNSGNVKQTLRLLENNKANQPPVNSFRQPLTRSRSDILKKGCWAQADSSKPTKTDVKAPRRESQNSTEQNKKMSTPV